jgi:hypothetical protein
MINQQQTNANNFTFAAKVSRFRSFRSTANPFSMDVLRRTKLPLYVDSTICTVPSKKWKLETHANIATAWLYILSGV